MDIISENHRKFLTLVTGAAQLATAGCWEEAAVQAQLAARFAWTDHTGLFGSQELEAVLGRIRQSIAPQHAPARGVGKRRHVIHVATQVYGTGGHTQSIAHWVRQDPSSQHELIITRQGSSEVPAKIASCLPGTTALTLLDRKTRGLVARAALLRHLVSSADVVVVHAHPHDVVPSLALGTPGTPPAVYVNHADHVFWQGTSAASVVMCLRESGRILAVDRRGVDPGRCVTANRPLELSPASRPTGPRTSDRRRELGASEDDFVVVSAAAGSKYDPVGPDSVIGLFQALLREVPQARLIVAGPAPSGIWAKAEDSTGGRIRAIGRIPNISGLLSMADAYLDSFPFASLTSLLEAGTHGLPLVTFRGHPEGCGVLGSDSPGLDHHLLAPVNAGEFVAALKSLASSADLRAARGAAVRQAVLETHSPSAWQATAERVYAAAANALPTPVGTGTTTLWSDGPLDRLVAGVQLETGYAGMGAAMADTLPYFSPGERVRQWAALRQEMQLTPWQLLPDPYRCWLTDARRRFLSRRA